MVGQQEPVVTGDAVVLDVQIAQLPIRALSAAVLIIFTVLALVGYPTVFETATRGRSLGKIALGLRVVSADGGPERFRQALFRALAGVIEIWIFAGGPAVICSLLSPKGKRLGDIFAGTIVISERAPRLTPPPPMPPQLAWWASSLQLSGLSAEQAELARQFLSRASQLDAGIRDQIAYRITGDVVAQISPPPPPGVPPQLVLAAVLAERHRRELARMRVRPAPPVGPPPQWPPWPQQPAYQQPAPPALPSPADAGGFTPPS